MAMLVHPYTLLLTIYSLHGFDAIRLGQRAHMHNTFSGDGESEKYIIASFPDLQEVNYARLPDPTWRPLVPKDGLQAPEAIGIDRQNHRLFVADPSVGKVFWYQLHFLPDGKLATDGQRHLASDGLAARSLAIDAVGNLYAAGRNMPKNADAVEAVYKQDFKALTETAMTGQAPPPPLPVWTRANTAPKVVGAGEEINFQIHLDRSAGQVLGADVTPAIDGVSLVVNAITGGAFEQWNEENSNQIVQAGDQITSVNEQGGDASYMMEDLDKNIPLTLTVKRVIGGFTSAQLYEPSALAVDLFRIYWGNSVRGPATAAVVQAAISPPPVLPETALRPLADNVARVTCLARTPTYIFYAAQGGIYGVPQGKAEVSCGHEGGKCPRVAVAADPTGLVWDGESTVYVADKGKGAIYSFASGTITPHVLEKVGDAHGVYGLAILNKEKVDNYAAWAAARRSHSFTAIMPLLLAAVLRYVA